MFFDAQNYHIIFVLSYLCFCSNCRNIERFDNVKTFVNT